MITEILKPIDDSCEKSLKSIHKALESKAFLAGLGKFHKDYPIPSGFNVVTDYDRCNYLLSENMWEEPDLEGAQNYEDVLLESRDYLGYKTYGDTGEADRRIRNYRENSSTVSDYIRDTIVTAYDQNGILDFAKRKYKNIPPETINFFIEHPVFNYTNGCFHDLIHCAYFGGLKKWPVYAHLLKCYSIGGFPTGWVGPMPSDGGKSAKCVQILHFGPNK